MVKVTNSPHITLNALSGLNSYQTMRIRGRIGKQEIHILIDCGSTHNFLDIHTAKKTTPMQVLVANGQRMLSTSVCHDLKWSLQIEVFTSDVMLLPLGGCEMVLGIQWLATLGDMQCNFKKLIMNAFILNGECFDEVFKVPKDLPPQRSHDHQIPLMPNTPPINVRPYIHPPNLKDAIEGMVKELMDSGVIRASQSPLSSPIVMVKKKDGTWRMCIDYRQPNKHTVKDKFPIPMIKEKPDLSAYPGLIQPLPIPKRIWKEISIDFIENFPTSHGKSVILVVVGRLSKYAHFIPLAHPFIASQVAQVFLDQVYKLHGLPESIVSERDKVFLSNFWKALFTELKVKLKLSTAYHPQTDGQTKVVNRSLGCYLRCMCGEKPKEWVKWFPLGSGQDIARMRRSHQSAQVPSQKLFLEDKENLMEVELIRAQLEVNAVDCYWLILSGSSSTPSMVVLKLILLGLVNTAKLS
ncbi:reverse transcriptase [Tanacetum coccineum]